MEFNFETNSDEVYDFPDPIEPHIPIILRLGYNASDNGGDGDGDGDGDDDDDDDMGESFSL